MKMYLLGCCAALAVQKGEKAGQETQPPSTPAAACMDGSAAIATLGQDWALVVFCTGWSIRGAKDLHIRPFWTPPGELRKPFPLSEQPKKKKCHFLYSSLRGGKALVLLLDSRPPVLLHAVNNQLHAMCIRCLGLILLQSRVLRLAVRYSCRLF